MNKDQYNTSMKLPFLKKRSDQGGGQPPIEITRPHDDGSSDLTSQVVDELIEAVDKKDIKSMRQALQALVLMIQDQDKEQDAPSPR